MPAPWVLALALVLGLLMLVPARRLRGAGLDTSTIGFYAVVVWSLAMLVAVRPIGTRVLVPVLLLAYLAPFLAPPETIGRLFRRREPRRPIKDVTPPDPPELPGGSP
jgi:hypothetical protein